MPSSLLDSWAISCRWYYSGWATQQILSGVCHTKQSPGDREADWQGPQVTGGRGQNQGNHLGFLISWISLAPGRSGPALVQLHALGLGAAASCLTAAWRQVNEVPGEASSKGSSSESLVPREAAVITAVAFPQEVRHAFPRRCRQGHVQSLHGTQGGPGLAVNISWAPGMELKWLAFRGNGRIWGTRSGWKGSILEPCSGSDTPLRPLGSSCSLGTWAPGYRATDVKGMGRSRPCHVSCFYRWETKEGKEELESQEVGVWE